MTQKLKNIKDPHAGQFQYQGRWVDKDTFRAWVYSKDGEQKLANTYKEFEDLTITGLWFSKQPTDKSQEEIAVSPKTRKSKDVVCSVS